MVATPCRATVAPPFAKRQYKISYNDISDARQSQIVFSDANPWNALQLPREPQTIVDLGANRGVTTLYWRARFPQAELHGVEMDRNNCVRCRQLFAENQLAGSFHEVAISDHDGQAIYRMHSSNARHRIDDVIENESEYVYDDKSVEVPCCTLRTFLDNAGIAKVDLLKVDIEGAEELLLRTDRRLEGSRQQLAARGASQHRQSWAQKVLEQAGFKVEVGDAENRTEWWCVRSA